MPQLVQLSFDQLADHAKSWDALWQRSPSRLPTQMADGIRLWRDNFAPGCELNALVVREGTRLVAALPLLAQRRGPFRFFQLPSNCTVVAGDLMVDPAHEAAAIESLAEGLSSLPRSIVAMDGIEIESPRWQQLIHQLQARGLAMHHSRGHEVGVVDVLHDWDAYQRSWSRNHRSAIKRTRKKLEAEGEVTVRRLRWPSDAELESHLETCFEIEDRSWKGDGGTSILRTPGLREYFQQEAKWMRDRGLLDLWLLQLNGRTIAFEYCHFAKGICLSHKISFDPEWEKFSPGRLLRYFQLQQYHDDATCKELDTLGVLCEAKAKWITRRYRSSRLYVAVGSGWPTMAIRGWKSVRAIRNRHHTDEQPSIKAGAERYLEFAKPPTPIAPLPCASGSIPVRSETPTLS